jgi:hypothetical protein
VVSDPLQSKLHLVNAVSFEKAGDIKVEGKPFNIVAVGGSGKVHEGEEGHNHEGHKHEGHKHEEHKHTEHKHD